MNRSPLPSFGLGPSIGKDWATGDVSPHVVWREGQWWTDYHYQHGRYDLERDRERLRHNRSVSRFLGSQSTDPGL